MSWRSKTLADEQLMDAERVLINPLNHSPSKQQFSFPKAQRWHRAKTQQDQYRFYDLPNTKSRIATTIGNSKRQSPSKLGEAPGPDRYTYARDGQFGSSRKLPRTSARGFAFGLGREEVKTNSFLNLKVGVPPPNAYRVPELPRREITFNKEQRLRASSSAAHALGPGAYQIFGSLEEDKQILSSQHRYASPKIAGDVSRKRAEQRGPPLYNPRVTAKGEQLDLFKRKGFRIGNSKRSNPAGAAAVPGPGHYKLFSEFISKGKF